MGAQRWRAGEPGCHLPSTGQTLARSLWSGSARRRSPRLAVEKEAILSRPSPVVTATSQGGALLEISPSTIYRKKQSWEEADRPRHLLPGRHADVRAAKEFGEQLGLASRSALLAVNQPSW